MSAFMKAPRDSLDPSSVLPVACRPFAFAICLIKMARATICGPQCGRLGQLLLARLINISNDLPWLMAVVSAVEQQQQQQQQVNDI